MATRHRLRHHAGALKVVRVVCRSAGIGSVDWMTGHSRSGDTALLSYRISKGPELSNPVDPNSEPTGNTIFVLSGRVKVGTLHSGTVVQGLW